MIRAQASWEALPDPKKLAGIYKQLGLTRIRDDLVRAGASTWQTAYSGTYWLVASWTRPKASQCRDEVSAAEVGRAFHDLVYQLTRQSIEGADFARGPVGALGRQDKVRKPVAVAVYGRDVHRRVGAGRIGGSIGCESAHNRARYPIEDNDARAAQVASGDDDVGNEIGVDPSHVERDAAAERIAKRP